MGIKSTLRSLSPVAAGIVAAAFSGLVAALAGYLVMVMGVFYCMFTRGYDQWEPFLDRLGLFVALPLALFIFVWLLRRSYRWCQSETQ